MTIAFTAMGTRLSCDLGIKRRGRGGRKNQGSAPKTFNPEDGLRQRIAINNASSDLTTGKAMRQGPTLPGLWEEQQRGLLTVAQGLSEDERGVVHTLREVTEAQLRVACHDDPRHFFLPSISFIFRTLRFTNAGIPNSIEKVRY